MGRAGRAGACESAGRGRRAGGGHGLPRRPRPGDEGGHTSRCHHPCWQGPMPAIVLLQGRPATATAAAAKQEHSPCPLRGHRGCCCCCCHVCGDSSKAPVWTVVDSSGTCYVQRLPTAQRGHCVGAGGLYRDAGNLMGVQAHATATRGTPETNPSMSTGVIIKLVIKCGFMCTVSHAIPQARLP